MIRLSKLKSNTVQLSAGKEGHTHTHTHAHTQNKDFQTNMFSPLDFIFLED